MNSKLFIITLTGIMIPALTGIMLLARGEKEDKYVSPFNPVQKEKPEVTLITVFDNYQVNSGLKTSWGFGCIIKTPDEVILFDTGGDSEILLYNMRQMDIDPGSINKIIISHIHEDHAGGLERFLEKNNNVTVFTLASFPESFRNMITLKGAKFENVSTSPEKISDFIYSTGEISGPLNEQALIINSKKGLIIITGCAHPGILNMIRKAGEYLKQADIYLVIGGFHNPPLAVVKEFRELGVIKVAPTHCTGDLAREAFAKEYGVDFIETGIGKIIEIK